MLNVFYFIKITYSPKLEVGFATAAYQYRDLKVHYTLFHLYFVNTLP